MENCGILNNINGQSCFAHTWAACQDDQVRGLETGCYPVEIIITGRHPGYKFFFLSKFFHPFEGLRDNLAERLVILAALAAGNFKDSLLSIINQAVNVILFFVTAGSYLGTGLDEIAQDRLCSDYLSIIYDIGRNGHDIGKSGKVGRAAGIIKLVSVV